MKPFWGIDITDNPRNETWNGGEFLAASLSSERKESLERLSETAEKALNKSELPLPLTILRYAALILVIAVVGGALGADVSIGEAYQNAPYLFWAVPPCLLLWAALTLFARRRQRTLGEEENLRVLSELQAEGERAFEALGVPADAVCADVLAFTYKERDGEPFPKDKRGNFTAWINREARVFIDAEKLFIADTEGKYAFPLRELRAIRTVNKSITLPVWNKETEPEEEPYKAYKLRKNEFDLIGAKPYHILELEHNGEVWGIYFPCYELPLFESLTGLKAE